MKHAGPVALSHLHDLLADLRALPDLEEMIQGIYHHGGAALLNFHASSAGCFANLRSGKIWKRYPVNTPAERASLLKHLNAALPHARIAGPKPPGHGRVVAHGMKLKLRARTQKRAPDRRVRKTAQRPRA